jgi:uncharacterized membrane protein YdjX (TVP38/TMEM64 family)
MNREDTSATLATLESMPFMRRNGHKVVAATFWLALISTYLGYTLSIDVSPIETLQHLVAFLGRNAWGPLIFVALYTLRPLVLFSATALSVAAGFLFGPAMGVLYTVIGANLSATLAFFVGSFFGQGLLKQTARKPRALANYATRLQERSFETVLIMRFLFLPFDLVNYLAGVLQIRYVPFILATMLGALPGTLTFVLFGASTDGNFSEGFPQVDLRVLAASAAVFVVSVGLSSFLKHREVRRHGQRDLEPNP